MLYARKTTWAGIALLALLAVTAISATYWMSDSGSSPMTVWWTCLMAVLTIATISIMCLIWVFRRHNRLIAAIRRQLRQFEQTKQIGLVMVDAEDDLGHLVCQINQYLTNVKFRFENELLQQKELHLQMQAAEGERRHIEAVLMSITEAVLVVDQYGELIMANQPAQNLFDFVLNGAYRLPVEQVLEDAQLIEFFQSVLNRKQTHLVMELQRTHPATENIVDLKVCTSCVMDNDNQTMGAIMVIHDITSEKEIARMKDEFVSNVSHELKTPLASISAYAEMLEDKEAKDIQTQHRFCEIIQEQAGRLNQLIDDILNVTRIESGHVQMVSKLFSLKQTIQQAVDTIYSQLRIKKLTIQCSLPDHDLQIQGDSELIYQALLNLLSNAVKYSPDGKSIYIDLQRTDNNEISLRIRDEGPGIPPDCLHKIFDKFYRVPENSRLAGGTGLGLHLVKKIVENLHQGKINVDSRPGCGSTFTLCLPAQPTTKTTQTQSQKVLQT